MIPGTFNQNRLWDHETVFPGALLKEAISNLTTGKPLGLRWDQVFFVSHCDFQLIFFPLKHATHCSEVTYFTLFHNLTKQRAAIYGQQNLITFLRYIAYRFF